MKNDRDMSHLVTGRDLHFLVQASYYNNAAIDAGNMAAAKAVTDSVRMFTTMMIAGHRKAQASIDSLAAVHSIVVPHTPDSLHGVMSQQLSLLEGRRFDSAYIKSQAASHQAAMNLYHEELNNGNNRSVKEFAEQTLPVVKTHHAVASRLSLSF